MRYASHIKITSIKMLFGACMSLTSLLLFLSQVIWQLIMHGHCSFRSKTQTQNFCRNEYNVTGELHFFFNHRPPRPRRRNRMRACVFFFRHHSPALGDRSHSPTLWVSTQIVELATQQTHKIYFSPSFFSFLFPFFHHHPPFQLILIPCNHKLWQI